MAAPKLVDRSTLEPWGTCPRQAAYIEAGIGDCVGLEAISGQEAHDAISQVVTEYYESQGMMNVEEMKELLLDYANKSRPDVQPDVLKAIRPFAWEFAKFLRSMHHQDIMVWDGGEGKHSSQLAHDFPGFDFRVTCELDFMHSTPSPKKVKVIDFKTGWTKWSESDVKASFQFGTQAFLVLAHWPEVECVEIEVWDTRKNHRTYPVEFLRRDFEALQNRVYLTAAQRRRFLPVEPDKVPAWPTPDRCATCPAIVRCTRASQEVATISKDPAEMVAWAHRAQLAVKKIADTLAPQLDGGEIATPDGFKFGFMKPKRPTKPKPVFYGKATNDDDSTEE